MFVNSSIVTINRIVCPLVDLQILSKRERAEWHMGDMRALWGWTSKYKCYSIASHQMSTFAYSLHPSFAPTILSSLLPSRHRLWRK